MVVLQFGIFVAKNGAPRGLRGRSAAEPGAWRRLVAGVGAALLALALAGCGSSGEGEGEIGLVEGFAGIVVADEPRAAVLGRDTLGNGGNAIDAAVAMYFTMAVTLPSRAGLGSGGACAVYDSGDNVAEALLFLPRAGDSGGVVPQGPRAMAALHARYGLLRWAQLLAPSESMARFGHPVSRAFARDLSAAADRIAANPTVAAAFRNNAGELPGEGDKVTQRDLAAVLGGLRAQGAAYFYSGVFTRRFAEAATAAGHSVTAEEVRGAVPVFAAPLALRVGDDTLYLTGPPAADGLVAAQAWEMLVEELGPAAPGTPERAHQMVEASARAFAQRADWMTGDGGTRADPQELLAPARIEQALEGYRPDRHTPAGSLSPRPRALAENPHGASFVAADRWNNVVACSLTMNGLFGAFKVAPGTGILLAAPPEDHANGLLSPSAAILANPAVQEAYFAAAASGGSAAPTALVAVALGALVDDRPLEEAVAAPRFHHGGAPDVTFYEEGADEAVLEGLRTRGHLLRPAPGLGRVNALYCPQSFKRRFEECSFASDPRGWGLGFVVQ
jgi:gamma-glutamyltranspeptidase/glutathione hydrolase